MASALGRSQQLFGPHRLLGQRASRTAGVGVRPKGSSRTFSHAMSRRKSWIFKGNIYFPGKHMIFGFFQHPGFKPPCNHICAASFFMQPGHQYDHKGAKNHREKLVSFEGKRGETMGHLSKMVYFQEELRGITYNWGFFRQKLGSVWGTSWCECFSCIQELEAWALHRLALPASSLSKVRQCSFDGGGLCRGSEAKGIPLPFKGEGRSSFLPRQLEVTQFLDEYMNSQRLQPRQIAQLTYPLDMSVNCNDKVSPYDALLVPQARGAEWKTTYPNS